LPPLLLLLLPGRDEQGSPSTVDTRRLLPVDGLEDACV